MKKMKKVLCCVLAIMVISSLFTGCSLNKGNKDAEKNNNNQETTGNGTKETGEQTAKPEETAL